MILYREMDTMAKDIYKVKMTKKDIVQELIATQELLNKMIEDNAQDIEKSESVSASIRKHLTTWEDIVKPVLEAKRLASHDKATYETIFETAEEVYRQIQWLITVKLQEELSEAQADDTHRLIGYMRISTDKESQTFNRQEAQLLEAGVKPENIYRDRVSGAKRERSMLDKMLSELQRGDTVLIVSIDRLSRSTKHLLEIVETIKNKKAFLKSISDTWLDTSDSNPMSDFLLTIMGALAQMERQMITQRVKEGVKVAKEKGVKFGRPTANKNKVAYALELYNKGEHTSKQIADITGISRATLFRKIREQETV